MSIIISTWFGWWWWWWWSMPIFRITSTTRFRFGFLLIFSIWWIISWWSICTTLSVRSKDIISWFLFEILSLYSPTARRPFIRSTLTAWCCLFRGIWKKRLFNSISFVDKKRITIIQTFSFTVWMISGVIFRLRSIWIPRSFRWFRTRLFSFRGFLFRDLSNDFLFNQRRWTGIIIENNTDRWRRLNRCRFFSIIRRSNSRAFNSRR